MKKHLLILALAVVSFNITAQFTSLNGPSVSGECRGLFTNESMTLTSVGENLWRSTDDGLTWELITVDPEENTDPICFAEHNGVIVMGTNDADRVYRSTDNGLTWETANTGMPTIFGFPGAVPQFASVFNGVFYMAGTNHVRRSLDLGLTWDTMDVDGLCYGLGVSDTEVWVSINSGIYASSDDGDTWELRTSPVYAGLVTADPSGYAQIGDRLVCSTTLAAGAGIFYSDDNGSTWTISETPLSVCRDVEVIGDAVYVTANSGLYKSLDQGVTWALAGAGGNARLMSYNDDYLWFGSGSGSIRVDLNTEVVDQMDVPASTPQNIQSNGSVLFALSSGDLFTSPIAGGDWTNVSDNINADGQVVHFYNDGPTLYVVFELNFETFLYESADNGANFTLLSSLSITDNMNAVYSFNPLMLTGNNNDTGAPYILVSIDDGLTFTEANINDNGINVVWESFENFSQAGSTLFAHSTQGYLVSSDNGSNWDYTEFDNGELSNIVGWDGRWLRFSRPFGFQYNIEISTDDGETWTTFFDGIEGFPNVSGPSGLWMEDGVIYSQNHVGNAPNGGMFIKLEESDSEWQYMTDVDALPYNISSFAIENNEIFVGVPDLGVWSNSSDIPDFIEDSSFSAFAMVPNPASEEVSFLGLDGSLEVSVYTSTGQLLRTEKLEHTKMNIADLPSGCYLLTVSSGNQVKRVQLLKN